MAVALGGTKTIGFGTLAGAGSATSSSWNISGFAANRAIVIHVGLFGSGAAVTSVTWSLGGGTGVAAKVENTAPPVYLETWVIPAPTNGTGTYTVNISAACDYKISADCFTGADQTTPCPTGAGNVDSQVGSTPTPHTITLSNLTASDAAAGIGINAGTGDGPHILQSETYNDNSNSINEATGYHLGTGALECSWAVYSTACFLVAVRVVAAATGGSTIAAGSAALILTGNLPTVVKTGGSQTAAASSGSLLLTGQQVTPQRFAVALPVSEVTDGAWLPGVGGGADLFDQLNDESDADYDYTLSNSTMEVKFAPINDPQSATGHSVAYRIKGTGANTITVRLMQGAGQIAAWTHNPAPGSLTSYEQVLSAGEANSISDYTDLRLRVITS